MQGLGLGEGGDSVRNRALEYFAQEDPDLLTALSDSGEGAVAQAVVLEPQPQPQPQPEP